MGTLSVEALGSTCQGEVRNTRFLLGDFTEKHREMRQMWAWEACGLGCSPRTCGRRGGREDGWVGWAQTWCGYEKSLGPLTGSAGAETAHLGACAVQE